MCYGLLDNIDPSGAGLLPIVLATRSLARRGEPALSVLQGAEYNRKGEISAYSLGSPSLKVAFVLNLNSLAM